MRKAGERPEGLHAKRLGGEKHRCPRRPTFHASGVVRWVSMSVKAGQLEALRRLALLGGRPGTPSPVPWQGFAPHPPGNSQDRYPRKAGQWSPGKKLGLGQRRAPLGGSRLRDSKGHASRYPAGHVCVTRRSSGDSVPGPLAGLHPAPTRERAHLPVATKGNGIPAHILVR